MAELDRLVEELQPVGDRVSPATANALTRSSGAGAADVLAALRVKGLEVEVPPRLPHVPHTVDSGLVNDALGVLGHRHIVEFLLNGSKEQFHVVDSLYHVSGSFKVLPFQQRDLDQLRALWEGRSDAGRAAALYLLDVCDRLMASDPMGLRHLALAQIVNLLRQRLAEGLAASALPAEAVSLGVTTKEAGYLGFAVAESNSSARHVYDEVAEAFRTRRLREAQARLRALPPDIDDPDLLELSDQVHAAVIEAKMFLRRGRDAEASGDLERAAAAYIGARELVTDHSELEECLVRCAPSAPNHVSVVVWERSVKVSWTPSSSTAGVIDYVVSRAAGGDPGPGEGIVIAETRELAAEDETAPVGRELWYRVFSRRSGSFRSPSGVRSGPVVLTPGVTNLVTRMRNCEVRLSWDRPSTGRVVVTRALEAPAGSQWEAVYVPTLEGGAVDAGLTVGNTYRYTVVTVFETPAGQRLESIPQVMLVTADADPVPVADLAVRPHRQRSTVVLRWGSRPNGQLYFLETSDKPLTAGAALVPAAPLLSSGQLLHTAPTSATSMEIPMVGGRRYVTPITVRGGLAAVGEGRVVATQKPVTGLSARRFQGEVLLLWEWPPGCAEAVVLIRRDAIPDEDDLSAQRVVLTRVTYEMEGGCRVRLPNVEHGFSVTAIGYQSGERLLSPAATIRVGPLGGKASVRYVLRKPGVLHRSRRILRVEATQAVSGCDFVLVARPGTKRPLEAEDPLCMEVVRVDNLELDAGGVIEREIDLSPLRRPCYLRGFVVGSSARLVDVVDPHREQLVVG